MKDLDYEKTYKEKKKKLRKLHQKLKDTKKTQEIYHKIMGSSAADSANSQVSKSFDD